MIPFSRFLNPPRPFDYLSKDVPLYRLTKGTTKSIVRFHGDFMKGFFYGTEVYAWQAEGGPLHGQAEDILQDKSLIGTGAAGIYLEIDRGGNLVVSPEYFLQHKRGIEKVLIDNQILKKSIGEYRFSPSPITD